MLHIHTVEEEVCCAEFLDVQVPTKKGDEGKQGGGKARPSRFAKQGNVVTARMRVPRSVCIETFTDFPQLGRFTLRDEGKSIAIGKIVELGAPE